ncbi:hypothetical protein LBMAG42_39190 [Deltaproteobacteria bacterium]|nr:hypothetical protein LBMAG42_39190 [Deltaproteobacteria bacterium]
MLIVFACFSAAFASPGGKSGVAAAGCTCHGGDSEETTVTLTADKVAVAIGEVVNLTLIVEHASAKVAGLDIAAKGLDDDTYGGDLAKGSNTRVSSHEITHSEPGEMAGGSFTYDFTWSSEAGGAFKLYGAGLAGNGDDEKTGDRWAFADSVTIDVADADTDVDADTDTDTDTPLDSADTGGEPVDPCGCATGEAGLRLVPLAAGVAALRRKRASTR